MCYTVDPNTYKNDLKGELSLSLFIHYNEDRKIEDIADSSNQNSINVDTIGKTLKKQFETIILDL